MPERIQLRRAKGWRKPEGARSVVRGTDYGNPYRIGDTMALRYAENPDLLIKDGDVVISRELAVALYRADLDARPGWKAQLARELRGRDLACWCPLDQPCHADVLLEIANQP